MAKKALFVAVDKSYLSTIYSEVKFAINTANRLAILLKKNNWEIGPLLYEKESSKDNIIRDSRDIFNSLKNKGDIFLFYYVGHGELTLNNSTNMFSQHLVNYPLNSPSYFPEKSPNFYLTDLDFTSLIKEFKLLNDQGIFITVLNCCYASGIPDINIQDNKNHILIASTDATSVTNYDADTSFFFEALIKSLENNHNLEKIKASIISELNTVMGITRPVIQFHPSMSNFKLI